MASSKIPAFSCIREIGSAGVPPRASTSEAVAEHQVRKGWDKRLISMEIPTMNRARNLAISIEPTEIKMNNTQKKISQMTQNKIKTPIEVGSMTKTKMIYKMTVKIRTPSIMKLYHALPTTWPQEWPVLEGCRRGTKYQNRCQWCLPFPITLPMDNRVYNISPDKPLKPSSPTISINLQANQCRFPKQPTKRYSSKISKCSKPCTIQCNQVKLQSTRRPPRLLDPRATTQDSLSVNP